MNRPALACVALIGVAIGCTVDRSGDASDEAFAYDAGFDAAQSDDSGFAADATPFDGTVDPSSDADAISQHGESGVDATDSADAGCKPTGGATACTDVQAFSGKQIVDALPDEWCALEYQDWDSTKGDVTVPSPADPASKVIVRMRFAWSGDALHAFISVTDSNVIVSPDSATAYAGDSVELYVSAFSTLGGRFDDTNDRGAKQIVISPPSGGTPAHAQIYLTGTPSGTLPADQWQARLTPTGYDVELQLPWTSFGGDVEAANANVGLDVAVNSKWTNDTPQTWSAWRVRTFTGTTTCGGAALPWCDDRTWCKPKLDAP